MTHTAKTSSWSARTHLATGEYAFILCGLSGRKIQSKSVLSGVPLDMFLESEDPCTHCARKLMRIINRKRAAKGKESISFEQYRAKKLEKAA